MIKHQNRGTQFSDKPIPVGYSLGRDIGGGSKTSIPKGTASNQEYRKLRMPVLDHA